MKRTKVLVADDSGVMRLLISNILKDSGEDFEVVDTVKDGREAALRTCELKPDVVLMDMNMGEYDGLHGVTEIMKNCPTPVIILSAVGNTDMSPVLKALELGAFDYLNKPEKNSSKIRDIESQLVRKVKAASLVKPTDLLRVGIKKNVSEHSFSEDLKYDAVMVGSSTGGPTAVEKLLMRLPGNMPIPVVVAQHMPSNFITSFVSRLNDLIPLEVKQARLDEILQPGTVYIAPGNRNITLKRDEAGRVKFSYTAKRYEAFNFPSVDGLMEGAAEVYKSRVIGVILTGMGKDGAIGMKKIKESGGYTIAQDKKTSVVWGMPGEVVARGLANAEVPIDQMGNYIVGCLE